jgi:nucleotide-binding universal stress UspA family protein
MIHLAYDGSVNGDWVAWYALNLAARDVDHRLCVIHINTDEIKAEEVREKAAALESECAEAGVEMILEMVPSSGPSVEHIFNDIKGCVHATPGTLLVCGARIRAEGSGYLAGTVSQHLLADQTFDVMAVRVAQPGLLGVPQRFLLPVAGDRDGFLEGAQILRHFGPDVLHVNLLRVVMIKRHLFRRLLGKQAEQLREKGWASLLGLDADLAQLTGVDEWKIDANVVISDDWAQEVIISANRHKSHLILMEASIKDLAAHYAYGNPLEVVLRDAPCDVAIYRGV